MAKSTMITAKLALDSQINLKNVEKFEKIIKHITEDYTFDNAGWTGELDKALTALQQIKKTLSATTNEGTIVSDKQLKDVSNANKEVQKLYKSVQKVTQDIENSGGFLQFSKGFVAEKKKIEKELQDLKTKFKQSTNLDYDSFNISQFHKEMKQLKAEQEALEKMGPQGFVQKTIENTEQKLVKANEQLQQLKKLVKEADEAYNKGLLANAPEGVTGALDYKRKAQKIHKGVDRLYSEGGGKELDKEIMQRRAVLAILEKYKHYTDAITNGTAAEKKILEQYADELNKSYNNNQSKFEKRLKQLKEESNVLREKYKLMKQINDETNQAYKKSLVDATREKSSVYKQAGTKESTAKDLVSQVEKEILNLSNSLSGEGLQKLTVQAELDYESATQNVSQKIAGGASLENMLMVIRNRLVDLEQLPQKANLNLDSFGPIKNELDPLISNINAAGKQWEKVLAATAETDIATDEIIINSLIKMAKKKVDEYDVNPKQMSLLPAEEAVSGLLSQLSNETINDFLMQELKLPNLKAMEERAKIEDPDIDPEILDTSISALKEAAGALVSEFLKQKLLLNAGKTNKYGKIKKDTKNLLLQDYASYIVDIGRVTQTKFASYNSAKQKKQGKKNVSKELEEGRQQHQKSADKLNQSSADALKSSTMMEQIGRRFSYFADVTYYLDKALALLNEAVQKTKEMDKDLTQIGLVLGKTSGEMWKSFDTYNKMANRLGTTTSEITGAMKLFYQQGLSTSEVNKMVEASAIAAALGETSLAEASEGLTTIINSYRLSATQAMDVTDKISAIAIKSAADFNEMSEAIQKVASSSAAAGLDLDHMMGYLAKMINNTKQAA